MNCPKCNQSEIGQEGTCPACGFRATPQDQPAASAGEPVPTVQEEVPEWRQELSRRLLEIKEKRERGGARARIEDATRPLPFPEAGQAPAPTPAPAEVKPFSRPARKPTRSTADRAERVRQKFSTAPPLEKGPEITRDLGPAAVPAIETQPQPAAEPVPEPVSVSTAAQTPPKDIRQLIDDVIASRTADSQGSTSAAPVARRTEHGSAAESKLILLSRTLSGLIDLLILALFTIGFVFAEDYFGEIEFFDFVSLANAGLLFAAVYLLYALFFLGMANQTIGMMFTNLRVIADSGMRPTLGRTLVRSLLFLPSLFGLGIGLIWGCFDREARCLHDRLSRTHVEPLTPTV